MIRAPDALLIRPEIAGDHPAILELNRRAFGGADEAELVDRLRADGDVIVSLVALEGDEVVGHILFSALPIETPARTIRGAALAPMAVRPDRQRRGIGSALVSRGLSECRQRGAEVCVVLGHEAYYPRFGFSPQTARELRAPFSGDAFMALELTPGVLRGVAGSVRYPRAFGLGGP